MLTVTGLGSGYDSLPRLLGVTIGSEQRPQADQLQSSYLSLVRGPSPR